MKKTILMCVLAAASAVSFTGCEGSSTTPKTFGDSLSYYLGKANGMGYRNYLENMPEDQRAKMNDSKAFLAGVRTVLNADTADQSYVSGIQMGMQIYQTMLQLKEAGIDMNTDMLLQQLNATLSADSISTEDMDKTMNVTNALFMQAQSQIMQAQMLKRQAEEKKAKEETAKNEAAGKEYVAKQKAADNSIVTTQSGLSYKVTKQGTGAVATASDKVKVKYTGRLIDGKEFDSSKGQAVEFPVRGVVPGFGEALTTLPVGSTATLYIPAALGYGDRQMGDIPAGSTLVFDIEVVEVVPAQAPATQAAK